MDTHNNRFTTTTRKNVVGRGKEPLSVVILASLPGSRMRSYGPQCLIKTKNGQTLLEQQYNIISSQYTNIEFVLVGGFEIDRILKNKPKNIRVVENLSYDNSNEIEEARLGINNITTNSVLLICGDIFLSKNSIINITNASTLIIDNGGGMLSTDPTITTDGQYASIISLVENNDKWSKTVFLTGKEFNIFKSFVNNRNNSKMFLYEGINHVIDKKGLFNTKYVTGNIHVDSSKEMLLI